MSPLEPLRAALRNEGYLGEVFDDAGSRAVYGTDNSIYQLRPQGAVVPTSASDLVAIAKTNHELGGRFELVARGGGTGTNGQSLTNGLVIDTKRKMNNILSIDADAGVAVVQPGVVLGQLNAALKGHGLFFAPHTSTSSRATIGGVASTDAAGKGSLVYGRANKHILGIEGVLVDGTPWSFGKVSIDEAARLAARTDRVGDLHRLVLEATNGVTAADFPDVPRGFTGYNLGDARSAAEIDMTKLLCGSEGTLALMSELTVRLTPLPRDVRLAVIAFATFEEAIRQSNILKASGPIAIECLDERTIGLATGSPAWPKLQALLPKVRGSLLLMEFDGDGPVAELRDLVADHGTAVDMAITNDPGSIAAVWKVRADAVGLLGQAVDGRRSVPFVEDCAVPPQHLDEFVAGFREVLDGHGLSYGMFGHADVGCVHVRPALDLYDVEHEAMVRSVSDSVAALVSRFGGVLWGEHGRGFRGEYLDLSDDLVRRMELVKTAFDPQNLLNPGKLYSPNEVSAPIKKIDEVPLRIHRDRTVAKATRVQFDSAFACNGNGLCHHWGEAEVMCPSYKATLDPRLSPKGRADLLRSWTADPDNDDLAADVAASLNQCLSCSACTGRCPVQVDIPEMKSRFYSARPETDRTRTLRQRVLRSFESLAPAVQAIAGPVAIGQRLSAPVMAKLLGIVDLPHVPTGTLSARLKRLGVPRLGLGDPLSGATVIIVPDAFTCVIDPSVMEAAIKLLRAAGERPAMGPFVPSGKYDHVKGDRKRFARAVKKQREMVEKLSRHQVPLVILEPAVFMLHEHEFPAIDPTFPSTAVTAFSTLLDGLLDQLPQGVGHGELQLFGHCTETSLRPEHSAQYGRLLSKSGFTVTAEATTCCGMAGIFGHEAENQEMSVSLFETYWRPLMQKPGPVERCAPGYSCRSQSKRLDGAPLSHPYVVAARAMGL